MRPFKYPHHDLIDQFPTLAECPIMQRMGSDLRQCFVREKPIDDFQGPLSTKAHHTDRPDPGRGRRGDDRILIKRLVFHSW